MKKSKYSIRTLTEEIREARKNPTPAEKRLWQELRSRNLGGYKFRRQHRIMYYVADFYCFEAKLIVELDGGIHQIQKDYDEERDKYLRNLGLTILRFTNDEVMNDIESVKARIMDVCAK